MIGAPGETLEEAAKSIAAAHAAGVKVTLAQYSPIPGSAMFERARRIAARDITEPLLQNNTLIPVGPLEASYQRLKDFALGLNHELEKGRVAFTPAEVQKRSAGFAGVLGL